MLILSVMPIVQVLQKNYFGEMNGSEQTMSNSDKVAHSLDKMTTNNFFFLDTCFDV